MSDTVVVVVVVVIVINVTDFVVIGGAVAVKIDFMMDNSTPERFEDRGKY